MAILTIQPDGAAGKDSHVNSANADTNYGSDANLEIGYRSATGANSRAYIQFDLSSIPDDSIINSAVLSVYQTSTNEPPGSPESAGRSLYYCTASWVEGTITWNAQPAVNGAASATASVATDLVGFFTMTITSLVSDWFTGAITNNGFMIRKDTESAGYMGNHDSSDGTTAAQRPKLAIDYTPPVRASRNLLRVGV